MHRRLLAVLFAVSAISVAPVAGAVDFQFVSDPDSNQAAAITFDGTAKTITFPDADNGFDFFIAGASDPALVGLRGNFNGTFAVSGISADSAALAAVGPTTFSITDGLGSVLTADLSFDSISRLGSFFALNFTGSPNLSNITYGGSLDALLSFRDGIGQSVTLTGVFNPPQSLVDLMAVGALNSTTYSGSAVPEPSTLALFACGLLAVAVWSRSSKRL